MLKRILFLLLAFGVLIAVFVLVFPMRSFFPTLLTGAAESVLIVYDEPSAVYHDRDTVDALSLRQLLGHFNARIELVSTGEYAKGSAAKFSRVFYFGSKHGQRLPTYLLDDISRGDTPVWWIDGNLDYLEKHRNAPDLGFELIGPDDTFESSSVEYKDRILWKKDPATFGIKVTDPARVRVLATATTPEGPIPWVVRSGDFWYTASNPFSYAVEGSCYLAFADLLHDFLGEKHPEQHRALVRIEDVHVMRDPKRLMAAADYLYGKGVPFGFTLIPVYVRAEGEPAVYMSDNPEFLKAVKYMIAHGGVPVLHGYTHQLTGETAVDYEFWSGPQGGPARAATEERTRQSMRQALQECFQHDIYPLVWTTPHYAASQENYDVFSEFFTTVWERRQPVDLIGSDQFFPYLIKNDMHSQIIIPEDLGYLTMDGSRSPEALIDDARNTMVVRDGYASFFYHSFLPLEKLTKTVEGIEALGYTFVGLTDFNCIVNTGDRIVLSGQVEASLDVSGDFLHEFTIDENGNKINETFSFRPVSGDVHRYITMGAGHRKVLERSRSTPPLTLVNAGKFRPSISGITHPLALFLLFAGLMILIVFLALWIYLLIRKSIRAARERRAKKAS